MASALSRWKRVSIRWNHWTEPAADGLPNWRVALAFPALILMATFLLTAFTVNGNSSGYARPFLQTGADPALLAGAPQAIRSDDWNVNAPLTIAQDAQGLPERNRSLVGGQDAAVPQDLPRTDWSVVFRPQLWAFPFADLGHAVAWRWWAPAAACLALAYLFGVTVLPRRPVLAAIAAIGLTCSPFLQWWFQSVSFWPIAWGLSVVTALVWATRSRFRSARWGWAAVAGFLTPVAGMGIYAPYLIPVALVVVACGVGAIVVTVREGPRNLLRFVPILVAGAVGALVTVLWLRSKQRVVDQLVSTVYPGERLETPGVGGPLAAARGLASSFTEALSRNAGFLGVNSSEASTFFLLGAFTLPVVVWLIVHRARLRERQPTILIAIALSIVVLAAFVLVPGWEPLARLLFLDRTTATRVRIGLGFGSFLMIFLVIRELEATPLTRRGAVVALGSGLAFLGTQVAIALAVVRVLGAERLASAAPLWWLIALICSAAVAGVTTRRPLPAVAVFAAFSLVTSALVNPIYLGIYNMRTTPISAAIQRIDAGDPGRWTSLGDSFVTALVTESGVRNYAGIQGAPQRSLWQQLDPTGRYEPQWNRLANIGYEAVPGIGRPTIVNPAPDQILVRFDPCEAFAQRQLSYVVSNRGDAGSACLRPIGTYPTPSGLVRIFRVVAG